MKPNEVTLRDVARWMRYGPVDQPGQHGRARAQERDVPDPGKVPQLVASIAAKARLADLGEQTSALAHELRQPLFSISMANENLRLMLEQGEGTEPQLARAIARIAEQVRRAQSIIDRTLAYASGGDTGMALADLGLAIGNAVRFLQPMFDDAGIVLENSGGVPGPLVGLCQIEAEQVFVNILRNAMESIKARCESGWHGQGRIMIRVEDRDENVRCAVVDNGAGLAPDVARSVFQPFFTTKPRTGTGLGLHICRQVLSRAGGTMTLLPGEVDGARVDIEIPATGRLSDQ